MIALLLVLLLGRWSAECEAKFLQKCSGSTAPDCTVECEAGQSAGEPEGMPPVEIDGPEAPAPPLCRLEAILYKNFTSSPSALISVGYMNEDCGSDPPKIESETAVIHPREVYEGEEPECWVAGSDPPTAVKPCVGGCPCFVFMAWVRGLPGTHFIQVWGENEGYSGLQVELGRGQSLAGEKSQ